MDRHWVATVTTMPGFIAGVQGAMLLLVRVGSVQDLDRSRALTRNVSYFLVFQPMHANYSPCFDDVW